MAIDSIIINSGVLKFHEIFYSDYIDLGRINLLASLLIIFYFIGNSKNIIIKFRWGALFFINIFGAFSSRGRMPVLAFIGTLLFLGTSSLFSLLIKKSPAKEKILKTIFCTSSIVLLSFIFFYKQFSNLIMRMALLTQGGGESLLVRLDLFKSSFEAFYENPILGLGVGGFSTYYSGVDQQLYPHNIILEIGSELGILGLTSYFFLIGFCLIYFLALQKKYTEKKEYHSLLIMVLAASVFMFLNTMVSGDINGNRLFFTWIGIIYSIGRIIRVEESQISINNN
jgi:O-antigen ligase